MREDIPISNNELASLGEGEGLFRSPVGKSKILVLFITSSWALFQLGAASVFIIDSITMRAVHLGFAMLLALVLLPAGKKNVSPLAFGTGAWAY